MQKICLLIIYQLFLFLLISCKGDVDDSSEKLEYFNTSVGGEIKINTHWSIENSPFKVTSSITVNKDVTLSLDPGVKVIFELGDIHVYGTLIAIGEKDKHILFKGDGYDLVMIGNSSKKSRFYYSEFQGVKVDLYTPDFEMSYFKSNSGLVFFPQEDKHLDYKITNSTIMANNKLFASISTQFFPQNYGLHYSLILNNVIVNNSTAEHGFLGYSLGLFESFDTIKIINSSIDGIKNTNNRYIEVKNSNIKSKTIFNIINESNYNINAQFNWWGTTNDSIIQAKIYDKQDSIVYGKADYSNYLTAPVTVTGCGW